MVSTETIAAFRCGIGNFIEATPLFQALASMDRSGQIDIAIDSCWRGSDSRVEPLRDMAARMQFIQEVVFVPFEDRIKDYKVWFWARWLGSSGLIDSVFSPHIARPNIPWDQNRTHESDHYLEIARKFYDYTGPKPHQVVVPAPNPTLDRGRMRITLCNGGFGHYIVEKKWDYFPQLAADLKRLYGSEIAITIIGWGSELSDVTDYDENFAGKCTVTESFKIIEQTDLLITTDTGNMHAADALGVPMIVIWGGTSVPKNRPYESPAVIIHHGLACQPCHLNNGWQHCKGTPCISGIGPGEVIHHVRKFMAKKRLENMRTEIAPELARAAA